MKKIIVSGLAALALVSVQSCKTDFENDVNSAAITSGSANFTKYIALGNSLTAGYRDGALYIDGQNESYPLMIAQQMQKAGGAQTFKVPLMADNLGGIPSVGISNKLVLAVTPAGSFAPVVASGTGTTTLASIYAQGPYQNMGVPGAKSYHLLAPGYGSAANIATGTANPYFVRFASSPTASVLGDAMAQNPTFFSLWIGNNDVLGYATTGGDGTNPITSTTTFTDAYTALTNTLTSGGAKGVVANIPNVTSIPFFTTVPYNPVPLDATSVTQLNQLIGALKQVLAPTGDAGRFVTLGTSNNPLLIKDESLTNKQAQITQGLMASGQFTLQQAGLIGAVFGQARHATSADLIPLSTMAVIGTQPSSPYAQPPSTLNKYGVTFPLEDKHVLRGAFTAAPVPANAAEPNEIQKVLDATAAFNTIIKDRADAKGLAFFNANEKMNELSAASGISFDGVKYTAKFVTGGTFSLDGVHLTGRGYAVIANEFIKQINLKYGSTLPQVNVNSYHGVTFP